MVVKISKMADISFTCLKYGIETVRKQDIHVVTKDTLDHIFIYPQSVI